MLFSYIENCSFSHYSRIIFVIILHSNLVLANKDDSRVKGKALAKKTVRLDSVSDFDDVVEASNERFGQEVLNRAQYHGQQYYFPQYPKKQVKCVNLHGQPCNSQENIFMKAEKVHTNATASGAAFNFLPKRLVRKKKYKSLPKYEFQPFFDDGRLAGRRKRDGNVDKLLAMSKELLKKPSSLAKSSTTPASVVTPHTAIANFTTTTPLLPKVTENVLFLKLPTSTDNPLAWEDSFLKGIYRPKTNRNDRAYEKNKRCSGNCKTPSPAKKPKDMIRSSNDSDEDTLKCLERHLNTSWCLLHRLYHSSVAAEEASVPTTQLSVETTEEVKMRSKVVEEGAVSAATEEVTMQKAIATKANLTVAITTEALNASEETTSSVSAVTTELPSSDSLNTSTTITLNASNPELIKICAQMLQSKLPTAGTDNPTDEATVEDSLQLNNATTASGECNPETTTSASNSTETTTATTLESTTKKTQRKRASSESKGLLVPAVRQLERDLVLIDELQNLLDSLKEVNSDQERFARKNTGKPAKTTKIVSSSVSPSTSSIATTTTTTTNPSTSSSTECCYANGVNTTTDNGAKLKGLAGNSTDNPELANIHYPSVDLKTNKVFDDPVKSNQQPPPSPSDSPPMELNQINNVLRSIHDVFGGTLVHLKERVREESDHRIKRNFDLLDIEAATDRNAMTKSKRFLFRRGKKRKNQKKKTWKKLHGRESQPQPFLGKPLQNSLSIKQNV